ncbi:bifunctional 4-hydroxy-2-oxoglutarate aldolase/2-dehydro-3-deoxy-phosphogluconate aldolase [Hellea sp.]|jgi:2-dehydro-3-deoxyphosphogluconate aldolase/(4S)-4-hydroxy-2-oxoglutarate aldolase|nr:bifunctional 4-hydroxy-2-oxoglutarate aldolase/2-dehydro-3-deoxy-phosphogluconate aldolase [Hellea sp.]MDA8887700.1 bifunctional 4-hydroxy-2-oxoglutarate aldolase/2-dehydro-3-deoxy-phosphogluconate aldolase [Hellea sp.]MDA9048117.1 bifunctional 4-hydroxy-2-oxoglutarate aldolase/2-dehydro-3-deoxy-phosphogluconate aldolase [Hellea sp.]MDB4844900.1 bifunctional 4-hydroxy-2-oxoglutarate aldolase/2-dehydro-3-deoxy-phosphogluconate aldolase [Hellea sp.]MDC0422107.1 bifunctional 4-hydroxy-2-oxoglut
MSDKLISTLRKSPIVPLVQSNDPEVALETARALMLGGINVIEVVLRTTEALASLQKIAKELPLVSVGAGTVLNANQAEKAIDHGAKFIVSPGLNENVVSVSVANNMPVLPGVATATELQKAWNMDLRTVKFFPAGLAGGPKMLKALSSVFKDMEFMPTGGVNAATLANYLSVPAVLACGGSWLTPNDAIALRDFETITTLAKEALSIAAQARS